MAGLLKWDDLNKYRGSASAPSVPTPAPVTASPSVPVFGVNGGSYDSAASPGGVGVNPGTIGQIGTATSLAGLATGNPALSQFGGMISTAGALAGAQSKEDALGVIGSKAASIAGVPSPVTGAVMGYVQSGMPGAKAGAVTGALASNPVTALAMGLFGLVTGKSVFSTLKSTFTPTEEKSISPSSMMSVSSPGLLSTANVAENFGMGINANDATVSNTGTIGIQDYANFGTVQSGSGDLSDGAHGTIADTGMGVNSSGQTVSNDATIAVQDNANFGTTSGGGGVDMSGAAETGMGTNSAGQSVSNDATVAAQDASFDSSSSSSSSDSKIVCTAMNHAYGFGGFRNAIWLRYAQTHLRREHEVGYHALFLPLVGYGYGGTGRARMVVRRVLEHLARHRTADLRAQMMGRKRDRLGRAYRLILEPLCYAVGRLKTLFS